MERHLREVIGNQLTLNSSHPLLFLSLNIFVDKVYV